MPGPLKPLDSRHTLGDAVFHALRDAIIDGHLQPGAWLRQEALAQDLGVSQMPIREALKRLVAEGLAERIPYRGVRVVEFTPEDVVDIFALRLVLESRAVRFAAERISDTELGRLRHNVREAAGYTAPEQMARRRQLNTEFHLTVCRASGRRYLVRQIETLWGWFPSVMLYEGMRRQEDLAPARLKREGREHQAILAALERRDASLAEEETRRHIRNLSQELTEVLGLSENSLDPLMTL